MLIALLSWHLRAAPVYARRHKQRHVSQVHWASGDWPDR